MAIASVPALAALLVLADRPREYVGAGVYGTSMLLLYSASATYHLASPRAFFHRLDRAMIYVLIAGTYTPFCLIELRSSWGIPLLVLGWGVAATAALLRLSQHPPAGWLNLGIYVALGWVGLVAAVPFATGSTLPVLTLVLFGGVLYSLGGIVHVAKRPDPIPHVFGYHEVFHALSVLAGIAFFLAVVEVLRSS